jgi:hypothetical protein
MDTAAMITLGLTTITALTALFTSIFTSHNHSRKMGEVSGKQAQRIDDLYKAVDAHDGRLKMTESACTGNTNDIVGMRTDIKWIIEGIGEIKSLIQQLVKKEN